MSETKTRSENLSGAPRGARGKKRALDPNAKFDHARNEVDRMVAANDRIKAHNVRLLFILNRVTEHATAVRDETLLGIIQHTTKKGLK